MKMRRGAFVLFASLLLPASGHCFAANVCPWMTQGSAARLLAGDIIASIQAVDDKHGDCIFSRADGRTSYTLHIAVGGEANVACPRGSAQLKGIGNEAYLCNVQRSSSGATEKVSSRVRDILFTVTLTERGVLMSNDARRDVLDQAAEQVAGNLF